MLLVTNNIDSAPILESDYEKLEEMNAETLSISFNVYKTHNNVGYDLIQPNSRVIDEDDNIYVVKQLTNNAYSKSIVATHEYYELIGSRKPLLSEGIRTFNELMLYVVRDTGWTIDSDIDDSAYYTNFGDDNVVSLIQKTINRFNVEMKILPGKRLQFRKTIGRNEDKQYRFKNNIKEISQSIDTSGIRTRIEGFGANNLYYQYTSPLVNNPLFGFIDAEPFRDDSITDIGELQRQVRNALNDTPITNIEASVLDTDGEIGDYVWVIHEEIGLEFQSRIISKRTRRDYDESIVEIGNAKKRTIEDVLIDQKVTVDNNATKAEEDLNKVEQETRQELARLDVSDNEIKLSVQNAEDTLRSEISVTATQIRSEVVDTENRLNSTITQTASSIQLQVNQTNQSVASLQITSNQIQSNVTNLQNSTQSSITQLSNQINLKVDQGGSITDINLTPGNATINATKINLNGAVIVNGSISGSSNISISNSAAIGNALYFGGFMGSVDFIEVSGGDMTFNSFGNFNFSGGTMYSNGLRVLTTADL